MSHIDRNFQSIAKTSPVVPSDPRFLSSLVDTYYRDRIQNSRSLGEILRGRSPRATSVLLHTNDYLSIANDPRLVRAEVRALEEVGHGDAVSRALVPDLDDAIGKFEQRIARILGAEAAVMGASGYCANTGLLQSIASPEVPVYIDMKAHASLWEGVQLSRATARPFRHNDPEHLERQVRQYGPGIIVVDALYSTTGTLAPLAAMVVVAETHGCVMVADETHSFGVQGPGGAGVAAAQGVAHRVHFRTIGLSKAMGGRGGVVACSARNAEFFRYTSNPMIFSTAVLPHEVAGFHAVLDIVESERWRRERVRASHAYLCDGLDDLGYNVDDSDAQIIALEAGPEAAVVVLRDALEDNDVFGSVFCAPATPKNRALVRMTINASLTREQLDHVLAACARIREQVGQADWASSRRRKGRNRLAAAAD